MATDVPSPPDAGPPQTSTTETFAVDALFFGEAPLYSGSPSPDAWMNFGYDIDGKLTTVGANDVCGDRSEVDGFEGIDNSFGHNVLADLGWYDNAWSSQTTTAIRDGVRTLLIQVTGLSPDVADATGLATSIFVGGAFGDGAPAMDTTTDWPVLAASLKDGQTIAGGARVQYADSFVTDGTFVTGTPFDEPIEVPISFGTSWYGNTPWVAVLRIHHAVITFVRSKDTPTRLTSGVIAGVLDPTELSSAEDFFGPTDCSGGGDQSRYADILRDGTNAKDVPCEAISIGLAFTAVQVANPTRVTTTDGAFDPCGPQ